MLLEAGALARARPTNHKMNLATQSDGEFSSLLGEPRVERTRIRLLLDGVGPMLLTQVVACTGRRDPSITPLGQRGANGQGCTTEWRARYFKVRRLVRR